MFLKFEKFVLEADNVWVQEKMLVISIFSLPDNAFTAPHGVFEKSGLCCKELRLAPFVDVGHDGKMLFMNLMLHSGKVVYIYI